MCPKPLGDLGGEKEEVDRKEDKAPKRTVNADVRSREDVSASGEYT